MIRKELIEFEDAFPDGAYTVPRDPKEPFFKVRALRIYCNENGIDPESLSRKELEPFMAYPE